MLPAVSKSHSTSIVQSLTDTILASAGAITIYGSLVMPQNFATAPSDSVSGAVLVTGSGPNVRWGTDGRTELFFDVSVALASKGIAVLVFDKRTCSGANYPVRIPNP